MTKKVTIAECLNAADRTFIDGYEVADFNSGPDNLTYFQLCNNTTVAANIEDEVILKNGGAMVMVPNRGRLMFRFRVDRALTMEDLES